MIAQSLLNVGRVRGLETETQEHILFESCCHKQILTKSKEYVDGNYVRKCIRVMKMTTI